MTNIALPDGYESFLSDIKTRIRAAQQRSALAVNQELVALYWQIGHEILRQEAESEWGSKIIGQIASDLAQEFPGVGGFSRSNLYNMRKFAAAWPDEAIVQQAVGRIPWGHNVLLLDRLSDSQERLWYAEATIEHGWSRNTLAAQIDTELHRRMGAAPSNFGNTLPAPQSELAQQIMKDPYNLDFITLGPDAKERHLEAALISRIRDFLMELGDGFAFLGSQVHMEVGGQDYYLDLLFYHVRLRCYVVVDLKIEDFKPEFAGKMNFYLTAVDDLLRHPDDQPSIGIILCRGRNKTIAEYALRGFEGAMAVSSYDLGQAADTAGDHLLPTVAELEAGLQVALPEAEVEEILDEIEADSSDDPLNTEA